MGKSIDYAEQQRAVFPWAQVDELGITGELWELEDALSCAGGSVTSLTGRWAPYHQLTCDRLIAIARALELLRAHSQRGGSPRIPTLRRNPA
jgi:hypothetical protein